MSSSRHIEVTGDPRVVLNDRAEATLTVLGCHHRGRVRGLFAGSTAEWLLVRPPAPMLLARHGYPTRSVALCVDASPHSELVAQAYWRLPWARHVEDHLVSVDDGPTDVERSLRRARAALPQDIQPARATGLSGTPRKVLAQDARTHQVVLVVMGTRGLTGLRRMRVGSTFSALLKDGSTNLLIAHLPHPEATGAT